MITAARQRFPALPVERACQLVGMSRATYYRPPSVPTPTIEVVALRDRIEEIVLEFAGYGYRRVTAQLEREGWNVNHKRVLRIMREESLLCQLRRRWVRTTDSEHGLRTYPNLLASCGWRSLTGINQAWVADITYIRLAQGFAYLAAILDAYSRRVVGWCLSRQIDAALAVAALGVVGLVEMIHVLVSAPVSRGTRRLFWVLVNVRTVTPWVAFAAIAIGALVALRWTMPRAGAAFAEASRPGDAR